MSRQALSRIMDFNEPAIRAAYRRGATDAYDSAVIHLDAAPERALAEWLKDLDGWVEGPPPDAPHAWDVGPLE